MENEVDEITINYIIKRRAKIRLFGRIFVKNNEKFCSIIFDGQQLNLQEYIFL